MLPEHVVKNYSKNIGHAIPLLVSIVLLFFYCVLNYWFFFLPPLIITIITTIAVTVDYYKYGRVNKNPTITMMREVKTVMNPVFNELPPDTGQMWEIVKGDKNQILALMHNPCSEVVDIIEDIYNIIWNFDPKNPDKTPTYQLYIDPHIEIDKENNIVDTLTLTASEKTEIAINKKKIETELDTLIIALQPVEKRPWLYTIDAPNNKITLYRKKPLPKIIVSPKINPITDEIQAANHKFGYLLGEDTDFKNVIFTPQDDPHIVITSKTGGGKSVTAQTICYDAAQQLADIVIIDPKWDYTGLLNQPNMVNVIAYGCTPIGIIQTIRYVQYLVNQRKNDRAQYLERNKNNPTTPSYEKTIRPIVVIIDELANIGLEFLKLGKNNIFQEALVSISQLARAFKIYMVMFAQSFDADVFPQALRANIGAKILLGKPDSTQLKKLFEGENYTQALKMLNALPAKGNGGRAVVDLGGNYIAEFQGYITAGPMVLEDRDDFRVPKIKAALDDNRATPIPPRVSERMVFPIPNFSDFTRKRINASASEEQVRFIGQHLEDFSPANVFESACPIVGRDGGYIEDLAMWDETRVTDKGFWAAKQINAKE